MVIVVIKQKDTLICFSGEKNFGPPIIPEFCFVLKTVDENGKKHQENHLTCISDYSLLVDGAYRFISRFELLERRNELVPADILTAVCNLKSSRLTKDARSEKPSNDLKKIMESGDHSDTTVRVKGQKFRLHRNILGACNPYFNSMFKSDMKENITGVVSIDDCEPDTFCSFIQFLYRKI